MEHVNIDLYSGNFDGCIKISSLNSSVSVARVTRKGLGANPEIYPEVLKYPGVYMLLVGNNQIYVGETTDTIESRIKQAHKGTLKKGKLDETWHTVIAFSTTRPAIGKEIVKYLENMLCEYVYTQAEYKCITDSPNKKECTAKYRKNKYLSYFQTASTLEKDIKEYLTFFEKGLFMPGAEAIAPVEMMEAVPETVQPAEYNMPNDNASVSQPKMMLFSYTNKNGVHCNAEIEVFPAHPQKRRIVLKNGGQISGSVSGSAKFGYRERVKKERQENKVNGKIKNNILQEDIVLSGVASSYAVAFLTGTSHSGNIDWKTLTEPHLSLGEVEDSTTN